MTFLTVELAHRFATVTYESIHLPYNENQGLIESFGASMALCFSLVGLMLWQEADPIATMGSSSSRSDITRPSTSALRSPAPRPLDSYPAWMRPLLKYGVGGAIGLWFIVGLGSMCWSRFRQAKTEQAIAQARGWLMGILLGIIISLVILGTGFFLSLRSKQFDLLFWFGAPLAVLLPPLTGKLGERWFVKEVEAKTRPTC